LNFHHSFLAALGPEAASFVREMNAAQEECAEVHVDREAGYDLGIEAVES
jgi:hypothetical protein